MCPCKSRSWPAFKYLWTTPHLFYSCNFLFQRLQQSPIFSHHCCKVLFPIFGNAGISLHFASCFSRQTVRVYLFTLWINVLNGVFFKVKYARKCELEYQSFFFLNALILFFSRLMTSLINLRSIDLTISIMPFLLYAFIYFVFAFCPLCRK